MPSTGSPITKLPYDVLQEIFTHCLPRFPLHYQQPNVMIAPMLLCHICSLWRMIALTSTVLWTHLSCRLTFYCSNSNEPASRTFRLVEQDIEFIRWWMTNKGQIPPFLRLGGVMRNPPDEVQGLIGDNMAFLLDHLTLAQYLELNSFFWNRIHERIIAGYPVVFPNLHTICAEFTWREIDLHPFEQALSLLPNRSLSALRRLSITEGEPSDNFILSSNWSQLTHVSLHIWISLDLWFSFIRAVPNLRWGHFDLFHLSSINHITPPQCTLRQLTRLFITVRGELPDRPLNLVFTNLHLPAVHTLSLSSLSSLGAKTWEDHRAITELYDVLKSTPAVRRLVLERDFLSLHTRDTASVLAAIHNIKPVWDRAIHLVHLQLDLPVGVVAVDLLLRNIFSADNRWLDLHSSACPIRTISLMMDDNGEFATICNRQLAASRIRKNIKRFPDVVFRFTLDSAEKVAARVQNRWSLGI